MIPSVSARATAYGNHFCFILNIPFYLAIRIVEWKMLWFRIELIGAFAYISNGTWNSLSFMTVPRLFTEYPHCYTYPTAYLYQ